MFPSSKKTFAQRALDALSLTRSFLTLEDDYSVDWEVDWDEPTGETIHPHRAPLRGGFVDRRPGETTVAPALCLSPVTSAVDAAHLGGRRRPGVSPVSQRSPGSLRARDVRRAPLN